MRKNDNRTAEKSGVTRSNLMIKKALYASLEAIGLASILFGTLAVYKGAGLHDLWIEFIAKLIP